MSCLWIFLCSLNNETGFRHPDLPFIVTRKPGETAFAEFCMCMNLVPWCPMIWGAISNRLPCCFLEVTQGSHLEIDALGRMVTCVLGGCMHSHLCAPKMAREENNPQPQLLKTNNL